MSNKPRGEGDFDPSEAAGEVHDHLETLKEGLGKLADILQRNGFTITTREPTKIILHRKPKEEVILFISDKDTTLSIKTDDHGTPGDPTFANEVNDIIQRSSNEFSSQGASQDLRNLLSRLIGRIRRKK